MRENDAALCRMWRRAVARWWVIPRCGCFQSTRVRSDCPERQVPSQEVVPAMAASRMNGIRMLRYGTRSGPHDGMTAIPSTASASVTPFCNAACFRKRLRHARGGRTTVRSSDLESRGDAPQPVPEPAAGEPIVIAKKIGVQILQNGLCTRAAMLSIRPI